MPLLKGGSGNDAKGFQVTKEKLAKALGEMTATEAIEFLAGPEPGKAGISDKVVDALRAEIVNASQAAKAKVEEAAVAAPANAPTGPEDDSEEAMRKWREYCAQALADAEKVDQAEELSIEVPTTLAAAATSSEPDDVPLFKPRGQQAAKPPIADASGTPMA